jgi:pyroglutamyl-peptidase
MGSEGPSSVVTVHVTGFKKFHGVSDNPTETIVTNLRQFMEKRGLPKGLVLGSCAVLETAGQGAVAQLYKVLQSAISSRENELGSSATPSPIVWVSYLFALYFLKTILAS